MTQLIAAVDEGGRFVFGWLAADANPDHFVFAVKVLPIIIFVSSLFSCLYYLGIMQIVVGGMATVSGAVLGGYIALGIRSDHLLAASFMAAPASLVMAKIMVPETSSSEAVGRVSFRIESPSANLIDAFARGASQGVRLAINIAAMPIAFVAMVYLVNGILAAAFRVSGLNDVLGMEPTLQLILGYLLAPLAFLMGVPWEESLQVGKLIGVKVVLNEFVAYRDLAAVREVLARISQR